MLNILWVVMMAGGIMFAAFHGTMGEVTETFINSSTEAVNLCIFMLGVIGLWNGMMEIAVKSGLMQRAASMMYPFIHWLFPDIPKGHKANEYIAARLVCVYPTIYDRNVLCQGIVCPTVYNLKDRDDNSPYVQSSWFARPSYSRYNKFNNAYIPSMEVGFMRNQKVYFRCPPGLRPEK